MQRATAFPAAAVAAIMGDGDLDDTFGVSGVVSTTIESLAATNPNTACAIQPDGKVVVGGNANPLVGETYEGASVGPTSPVNSF